MVGQIEKKVFDIAENEFTSPDRTPLDYGGKYAGTKLPIIIDHGKGRINAVQDSRRIKIPFSFMIIQFRNTVIGNTTNLLCLLARMPMSIRLREVQVDLLSMVKLYPIMTLLRASLDYLFCKLGINTTSVEHPIVMTEPIASPNYSRRLLSELLFECYGVPSATYGIDALFSAYENNLTDALIISSSHNATHVLPLFDGKGILESTKRLNYGGSQATDFMLRSMQLKYPSFPTKMTIHQAQDLVHNHTYVADNFQEETLALADPSKLAEVDHLIQFPFTAVVVDEKTEEELQRAADRKREHLQKLQDLAAKARLDKLVQREEELEYYKSLKVQKPGLKKAEWIAKLESEGFEDEQDFDLAYKRTDEAIKRARRKQLGSADVEETSKEPPNLPLLDIADDKLNEFELKEKRKQKLILSGWEARQRLRKEKEEEQARQAEQERQDEESRKNDPLGWVKNLRNKREELVNKLKERKLRKQQLSDRRSLASQMRMKSIAALASDAPVKKRRRGNDDDNFGADDNDWAVYREIKGDDDSEDDEEIHAQVGNIEEQLLEHDNEFTHDDTYEAQSSHRHTVMYRFAHGSDNVFNPNDQAQSYQLHINIERMRVPEVIFQPSIAGIDQAGLIELISDLMKTFDADRRKRLLSNVFLTGGHTLYPNIGHRLRSELLSLVPVDNGLGDVKVTTAKDSILDAWKGAAKWARDDKTFSTSLMSRQEWEECGHDYLKEHKFSNRYYPLGSKDV